MHPSITLKRVEEAVQAEMFGRDNPGFCKACGADADDVEPDARNYKCEECGAREVFGAAELLLEMV
jgi:hypothetical protein